MHELEKGEQLHAAAKGAGMGEVTWTFPLALAMRPSCIGT